MNLDKAFVADIETDGLLDELTKLHVLSVGYFDSKAKKWKIKSTKEKEDVIRLFSDPENTIVGHNFISFDIPAIELLYPDFEIQASIIDTLPLSYYLYSERDGHGLEKWGEHFGVPKPEIEDWVGLSYEEYRHRCEEDVKINVNLWVKILAYLRAIYDNDDEAIIKVINYFNFKAEELYIQQENKVLIDRPQAQENLDFLQAIIDEKTEELDYKFDGSKLTLSGDLDGEKVDIDLNISESTAEKLTIAMTGEEILAQIKAKYPEVLAMAGEMDVDTMVKGCTIAISFKK